MLGAQWEKKEGQYNAGTLVSFGPLLVFSVMSVLGMQYINSRLHEGGLKND